MHETQLETRKQGRQRRGSGLTLVREWHRMTEASMAKVVEVAKEECERMTRKAAEVEEAIRLAEAREHDDHVKVRTLLNIVTGGAVERLVRVSKDEGIKAFLRAKWWRV